ncbi:MAG: nucleotidyltransferase family protein [Phycisphaerae bacterium]|nr:nucleotidyltransferase family protein [Phycisphaerae bacterium]
MRRSFRLDPAIASQTPTEVFGLIAQCLSSHPQPAIDQITRRGWWEYVAAEAIDARMGAILLDRLTQLGVEMPVSAVSQMQAYRDHVSAANAYKFAEVGVVLNRLRMANVPYLLLKGAALNAMLYDAGLRPMTDVDVLIWPEDVAIADRVLCNAGACAGKELVRPDFYPRYYYEREYFTRRNPAVKIDLHCRPFGMLRYARTVPDDAMWNRHRDATLAGLDVQVPGPEEMLIHLAVHAACHGNSQLCWLYDILLWTQRFGHEINVTSVAEKCRRWRLSWPVHRALKRTQEWFGMDSDTKLAALLDATKTIVGPMDRIALAAAPLGQSAPVLRAMANAITTPGIRFRLGYLSAVLLPDASHLEQLYHRRHVGWQLAAHAVRAGRCIRRALADADAMTV